jgi:hypothetical protein
MTEKNMINKRKAKVARLVKASNKKAEAAILKADDVLGNKNNKARNALQVQYKVIKQDVTKLGKDISEGYEIAKNYVEKSGFFRQILKTK